MQPWRLSVRHGLPGELCEVAEQRRLHAKGQRKPPHGQKTNKMRPFSSPVKPTRKVRAVPELQSRMEWCEMSGPVILPGEPFHVWTRNTVLSPSASCGSRRAGVAPPAPCRRAQSRELRVHRAPTAPSSRSRWVLGQEPSSRSQLKAGPRGGSLADAGRRHGLGARLRCGFVQMCRVSKATWVLCGVQAQGSTAGGGRAAGRQRLRLAPGSRLYGERRPR